MKYLLSFCLLFLLSCNSGNTNNDVNTGMDSTDPALVQPPSDAIPEDMMIKNDSVVVPTDSILKVESGNQ